MSLCATPLKRECEQVLAQLIEQMPAEDLKTLAATEKEFKRGGFRRDNLPMLRKLLLQLATSGGEVSDSMRSALARRSRTHTLTGKLTPEALASSRHALGALLGEPTLLVALLLDSRESVRKQAEEWMRGEPPLQEMAPKEAVTHLREIFEELAGLLGSDPAETAPPLRREAWLLQKTKIEEQIKDLKKENQRLKGVEDHLNNTRRQLQERESRLQSANDRFQELEGAWRQEKQRANELATELQRERTHRENRLKAALDLALCKEFHGWLHQARAIEAEAKAPQPAKGLLEQADSALQRQAAIDRQSGNCAELRAKLARLKERLSEVRGALHNALRRAPELQAIEAKLAGEIERMERLLNPAPPPSELEEKLQAHIDSADLNELPRLRGLPDRLAELNLLDIEARGRLYNAYKRRLAAEEALGGELPESTATGHDSPAVLLLGRALAGQEQLILQIDGHNVLHSLSSRYDPQRGTQRTEEEKRQRLVDDVVRIAKHNHRLRVWILFDGPTPSEREAATNVRVAYSGGEGEHRADGVLVGNLRFYKDESPEIPALLVSNDKDLCAQAQRLGALTLPVAEFGAFFIN